MASLELTLLGGFRVRLGSGDELVPRSKKAVLLLTRLALRAGEIHTRETLIGLLWSDRGEAQARASLRQELTLLRKMMGASPSVLTIDGERLSLASTAVEVDVHTFEALARSDATRDLERAASLYRGPLLEGFAVRDATCEDWLEVERRRLRDVFLGVLDRLLARQLQEGAHHRATATAQTLLTHDPLREDAHRTLMALHAQQGRRSLALKQYQVFREMIGRELGVEPEPETVRLHQEIRDRGTPVDRLVPATMGSAPDLASQAKGDSGSVIDESAFVLPSASDRPCAQLADPTVTRPAIAVLPFENLSGEPEQQYFSDGITEDIITELSRWRQLTVLSRNSSFQYRDRSLDLKHVGRELGVRYVVAGSVRKVGEQLRVTTQLVDAASGCHLWAERYDRALQEIFAVQDEVVQTIVGTLVGRVQAAGVELAKRKPPTSLAAYDCVLRGHALPWGDPQADAEARRLYEKAIELDPGYGLAHALLALMMYAEWGADTSGSDAALDRAFALAKRAVELDENESMCQAVLGLIHLMRRSYESAEQYHRRAVEMNPSNPQHLADMGSLLVYLGRPDEGLDWLKQAKRVDPYFGPAWYWHQLGFAHLTARRYEDAIKAFERSTTMPYWVRAYIAACHAQLGRMTEAKKWAAEALRLKPDFSTTGNASKEPFKNPCDLDHLLESLRKAGIPETAPQSAIDRPGDEQTRVNPAAECRPAVAVLPFEDMTGDQEYFSDGLTEDLITALALWRSFPVLARNSTFTYKGRRIDVKRVASELGARYIVEGSVRKIGSRVRTAVQLIDATSGHHVWASRYDRELHDIFALQDELTQRITAVIAPELERAETKRSRMKRPADLDAWDCYLRGMALLAQFTADGNARARAMFEQSIALDPTYADAHTGVAVSHNRDVLLQCAADRDASLRAGMEAARRAVALDPSSSAAHSALGTVHIWRDENDLALAEAHLAFELNPNDALNLHSLGNKSDLAGDPAGIDRMVRAQQLNPLDPDRHSHLCFLARAYVNARRFDDAVACARAAIQRRPDYPHAHFILAIALAHLDRAGEAQAALACCDELHPGFVASRADWRPYTNAASNDHLREGLHKAGRHI